MIDGHCKKISISWGQNPVGFNKKIFIIEFLVDHFLDRGENSQAKNSILLYSKVWG